jgi:hypothetical protein
MHVSKRLLLACLTLESLLVYPALAADKVSLFKVVTAKDEIVIGVSDDELAKMDGSAAGVAKALVAKGSLGVWQYAVRKAANGDLEQAPLRKIGLIAADSLRVEPYATPLKVLPIEESQK